MRQVAKKGLITAVATGGVLAVTGGCAYADAGATGAAVGSPGVLSGNTVQVPVHVPVNVCGNTVNVVGALNPAFGNKCANVSVHHGHGHGAGHATAGSGAVGHSVGSPGVGSGNTAQVPVHVPVNACGNSVDVVGALNPTFGNSCGNVSVTHEHKPTPPHHCPPPRHVTPPQHHHGHQPPAHHCPPPHHVTPPQHHTPPAPQHHTPPAHHAPVPSQPVHYTPPQHVTTPPELAHTGADQAGTAGVAGAAFLLAGAALYRKGRSVAGR
ncbi:chaplin [Streptantibioticus parmotrematis]|uniref:chaplin n=1 Tax=Streptantibioticus parmotrematis TaxID=2873249 RepID=UPI00340B0C15